MKKFKTNNNNSLENLTSPICLGISGGSGSGKTTIAKELERQFGKENVSFLSHDVYYKDLAHLDFKERAKVDFDHPDSLETTLLIKHVQKLLQGENIEAPTYDFSKHTRTKETDTVKAGKIIILEGILLFSDSELNKLIDLKVFVDADDDIRFIRRLKRDLNERGRLIDDICKQYVRTVKPAYDKFVLPSREIADMIIPFNMQIEHDDPKVTLQELDNQRLKFVKNAIDSILGFVYTYNTL